MYVFRKKIVEYYGKLLEDIYFIVILNFIKNVFYTNSIYFCNVIVLLIKIYIFMEHIL